MRVRAPRARFLLLVNKSRPSYICPCTPRLLTGGVLSCMTKIMLCALRTHRRSWRLPQEDLTALLGFQSPTHISRLENGKRVPGLETALACALLFHVSPGDLFPQIAARARERVWGSFPASRKRFLAPLCNLNPARRSFSVAFLRNPVPMAYDQTLAVRPRCPRHRAVLRSCSFVGPESPFDWGIREFRGAHKSALCFLATEELVRKYNPATIVIEETSHSSRPGAAYP